MHSRNLHLKLILRQQLPLRHKCHHKSSLFLRFQISLLLHKVDTPLERRNAKHHNHLLTLVAIIRHRGRHMHRISNISNHHMFVLHRQRQVNALFHRKQRKSLISHITLPIHQRKSNLVISRRNTPIHQKSNRHKRAITTSHTHPHHLAGNRAQTLGRIHTQLSLKNITPHINHLHHRAQNIILLRSLQLLIHVYRYTTAVNLLGKSRKRKHQKRKRNNNAVI